MVNSVRQNVVVRKSKKQGRGVFTARDFERGEKILEIDDSHVVVDPSKLTVQQHEFDLDYLGDKIILMQAPEKYINHSCDPNVYVKTIQGIRTVIAMKKIKRGEEIAYDYSINGDNEGTFLPKCMHDRRPQIIRPRTEEEI